MCSLFQLHTNYKNLVDLSKSVQWIGADCTKYVASIKLMIFWDMTPCSLLVVTNQMTQHHIPQVCINIYHSENVYLTRSTDYTFLPCVGVCDENAQTVYLQKYHQQQGLSLKAASGDLMYKFRFLAGRNFSSQWCFFKIYRLLTRIGKNFHVSYPIKAVTVKKYPHMLIQITSLISLFMVFHTQLITSGTTDHQQQQEVSV